jgi:hypothetical protein
MRDAAARTKALGAVPKSASRPTYFSFQKRGRAGSSSILDCGFGLAMRWFQVMHLRGETQESVPRANAR